MKMSGSVLEVSDSMAVFSQTSSKACSVLKYQYSLIAPDKKIEFV